METRIFFLITLIFQSTLRRVALSVDRDDLQGDCAEYPMEPENISQLRGLLDPEFARLAIVEVVEIAGVVVYDPFGWEDDKEES